MLQRIGVFPSSMARFKPWATGLRAVFRFSQLGPPGTTHFRLISSLPGRTEAELKESDSKEAAESASTPFLNNDVKLTDRATAAGAKAGPVKGETRFREKVSVANLLQDLPEEETVERPKPAKPAASLLIDEVKRHTSEDVSDSMGIDPIRMLTELRSNDRAIELLKEIDNSKLITVLLSFIKSGTRPTPVLNAIAERLIASPRTFTPKECGTLLFCMGRLFFPNAALASKVCADLVPAIENLKPKEISGITKSLGILHFRNDELLAKICLWYENNIQTVKAHEIMELMYTLAYLDYRPQNKELYLENLPRFKQSLSTPAWLDIVHSLVVLGWDTPELLSSYLQEDLPRWTNPHTCNRVNLVQSYAQIKYKQKYEGAAESSTGAHSPMSTPAQTFEALKKVISVLSIFGSTDNVVLNHQSPHGLPIHATFLLDKNARLLPDVRGSAPSKDTVKVALMVWQYRDMILPEAVNPLGHHRCIEQLLEVEGYRVVRIPPSFSSRSHVENTVFFEKTFKEISSKIKT